MNIKATFQGNDAEATAQFGEVQYGLAATVEVGDVADGDTAQVYNVGTAQNARLNFVLPRGKQGEPGPDGVPGKDGAPGKDGSDGAPGKAATIRVGNVSVGETPSVENSGTENAAVLDFTLPQGVPGPSGKDGQQLWAAYVDADGHLIVQYEGTEAPPLRLDVNGHLLYDANGQTVDLGLVRGADGAPGEPGKDGIGVPEPSLADAGKVPAVTADGTGYELVPMSGGGGNAEYQLLANITLEQDADVIKADGFDVHELLVFFELKTTADLTPVFLLNGNWTTVGVYINLESKISASDYYQKYVVQAFADSGNAYAMRIGLTSGANVSSQRTGATEYGSITSAVLNKIGAGQYSVGCKMVVYGR